MCKGVRLRRVKVKGLVHKRQMKENTIPTDLSSKHEVCFMMNSAFKVMDTCLWYLANVLYVKGLRVNLLNISQICN